MAPSINSCRLGLPPGLGSPGPGSGARRPGPLRRRVWPRPGALLPAAAPRLYRERRAAPGSGASLLGSRCPRRRARPPAPDSLGCERGLGRAWNPGSGCACLWQEKFPQLRETERFKAPRCARLGGPGRSLEAGAPWLLPTHGHRWRALSVLGDSVSPLQGRGLVPGMKRGA